MVRVRVGKDSGSPCGDDSCDSTSGITSPWQKQGFDTLKTAQN